MSNIDRRSIRTRDEQQRAQECAREPIRTPGTVQPHGVLLVVDPDTFEIMQASDNSFRIFGTDATQLLGRAVAELTGTEPLRAFRAILSGDANGAVNPTPVVIAGKQFDAIVHRSGAMGVLEFEPWVSFDPHAAPVLYGAIHRLASQTTVEHLWAGAARELRMLTGFDRVVVYHFHPDGHGEIVAEERAEGMEAYLGLHFPASDIPTQARQLYVTKRSRVIVIGDDDNAPLVSAQHPHMDAQLDLGQAELRSVSPHHVVFMRNMGQASTLSLSLVHHSELVGMITCSHRTALRIPYVLRQGLEVLANQVALQLNSMTEIKRLTRQAEIQGVRARLVGQLTGLDDAAEALLGGELTVLDVVPADGATVRYNGRVSSVGNAPPTAQTAALVERVRGTRDGLTLVTDALPREHPDLAALLPSVAGLILLPFGGEGNFLAWFRHEIIRTVNWLGEQSPANRMTPLSPRNSFSSWSESVTGTAAPWAGAETEAAELCRDLDSALFHRAESELADLALEDPLTGLPNRRLLMDRLEHALLKYVRGQDVALLFVDLDGLKATNDSLGHDMGDALIVHAAKQIVSATRAEDTIARLGGDEFVVLCENTTAEQADVVADRILTAIRRPANAGGHSLRITASVGITTADFAFTAADLLREADAAMYRAKANGRDRASH